MNIGFRLAVFWGLITLAPLCGVWPSWALAPPHYQYPDRDIFTHGGYDEAVKALDCDLAPDVLKAFILSFHLTEEGREENLLMAAIANPDPRVVGLLLEAGAEINAQAPSDGQTALMRAAGCGRDSRMLDVLLAAGADPALKARDGRDALFMVLENRAIDDATALRFMKTLIRAGADSKERGPDQRTLLMAAARHRPSIAKVVLSLDGDVSAVDVNGDSALTNLFPEDERGENGDPADRANDEAIPKALEAMVKAGGDVNHQNHKAETALIRVIRRGDFPMLEILLRHGADPNRGANALLVLLSDDKVLIGNHDVANEPLQVYRAGVTPALRKLLKAGADIQSKTDTSEKAIHLLARYGQDPELFRLVIEAGADVRGLDGYGTTPLGRAASASNLAAMKAFLDAGADPNQPDKRGGTLICWYSESPAMTALLKSYGARKCQR